MKKLYDTSKSITNAMLAIGALLIILAIVLAITAELTLLAAALCACGGASLMLFAFLLSILVSIGEDIYVLAHGAFQEVPKASSPPRKPLGIVRTGGEDPALQKLIQDVETSKH